MEPFEQRIVDTLRDRGDVAAVYLFGSQARGTSGPGSDVDIGVLFATPQPSTLMARRFELEGEIERVLGQRVDLVELGDAPVDLRIRVLREGRLIVDRLPALRIAFEVQTRNEAFDLEPVLTQYRRAPSTQS